MARNQRKAETKPSSINRTKLIKKATKLIQPGAQPKTPPKTLKCISYIFFRIYHVFHIFSPFQQAILCANLSPFGNELIKEIQKDAMQVRSKLESFRGYVNKYLNMLLPSITPRTIKARAILA